MDSQAESLFTLTEQSLKNALDEALAVMKSFTTSTATNSITPAQIYTCSKAALLIAKLTQLLSQSSPAFWNSALSSLTAVEEFTNYARSTSSDLFGDLERVQAWLDFIEQAEHTSESFLDIGIECFGEIFPLPNCMQGHPAPRRQAGKATPTIPSRSTAGGGLGTDFDCDGGLQVAGTMKACKDSGGWSNSADHAAAGYMVPVRTICVATGQAGAEIGAEMAPTLNCNHEAPYVVGALACNTGPNGHDAGNFACNQAVDAGHIIAHSLRGEGFDAGEDGTGRGTPLVPVAFGWQNSSSQGDSASETVTPTLDKSKTPAVMVDCYNGNVDGDVGATLGTRGSSVNSTGPTLLRDMAVRRLTPTECERLQGFPDDYTDIRPNAKPTPDGPRYKALGNSMAVPVMTWIGQRIAAVSNIL